MAIELITGSAGSEHISSADDGSMYASMFGAGRYAVNQGDNLAATLVDSNTVQIGTGAGFIDGRYFRVTSGHTLSIDSGAQGMNRIDLIGVRYNLDSGTATETCTLEVVKGTATADAPTEPTYTDGDILEGATSAFFPLYSITITGITPATPVRLFNTIQSTVSCPWPVGAVLQMTNGTNPNSIYPGTVWERIQGAFLLGSSSSHALGTTGGAETATLTAANLPAHTHTYAKSNTATGSTAITKAQLPSGITGSVILRSQTNDSGRLDITAYPSGVFSTSADSGNYWGMAAGADAKASKLNFNLGGSGQGHTHAIGTASATSGSTGSGTAFDKMPPFKVVDMWERTA